MALFLQDVLTSLPEGMWIRCVRATVEQRIEELKNDLAADGFCLRAFVATESAFLVVLFTFNLLSLYRYLTTPSQPYRQPGMLRTTGFLTGALFGEDGAAGGAQALGGVGWVGPSANR